MNEITHRVYVVSDLLQRIKILFKLRFIMLMAVILVFVVGNFVYQMLKITPKYSVAFERSYFQIIAVSIYAFVTNCS